MARRTGVVANRRRGQHFLVDLTALDAIVEAIQLTGTEDVLEIGSGMGTLTTELAARARRLVAIDLDPACVRATALTLRGRPNVEVIEADGRTVEPARLALTPPWVAAGNLPYRLTGVILGHVFERDDPPERAVFLVQREVAARLTAAAGGWSLATVAVRSLATVERLADVPPHAFEPPPKVHSSVIRMRPLAAWGLRERRRVLDVARKVFQQRRKTLRHGVANVLGGDVAAASRILESTGIDAGRRPGTLSLDEWDRLARAVEDPTLAPP